MTDNETKKNELDKEIPGVKGLRAKTLESGLGAAVFQSGLGAVVKEQNYDHTKLPNNSETKK